VGLVTALTLLGFFKYYSLFATSLMTLTGGTSATVMPLLQIALPIGISFYTFHGITYLIDVYRGRVPATSSLGAYLVYVAYFPLLVAGPIERAHHLLPQLFRRRKFKIDQAADGCTQILAGYLTKMVVADNLEPIVSKVYAAPQDFSSPALMLATFLFGTQIYSDFSGYSNIAIGLSKLMGIEIMQNFRTPYFATTLPDFWRRWHISLSTFFRDYLYHPLGGNRRATAITIRNFLIVFAISGLWHGANWTFVLWGIYHGVGLAAALLIGLAFDRHVSWSWPVLALSAVVTQVFVMFGWVFFRSVTLADAMLIFNRMFDLGNFNFQQVPSGLALPLSILLVFLLIEFSMRSRQHIFDFKAGVPPVLRGLSYAAGIVVILLLGSGVRNQFIYFRF
jgi:alginate O-acetyltransferase complex protein AlgI